MATTKKPVLITGGAGLIGRILIARLHVSYALTSFDLQSAPGIPSRVGNLTDFPAVLHACQGHDTVVHLAADPRVDSPWASNLATNIQGGIVKLTQKIARLCSKERTIEGFGLSRAPVFSLFLPLSFPQGEGV
jgi:nucleoside-diphosphate-sugar epimerase